MTTLTKFDFKAAKSSVYEFHMYITEINRLAGYERFRFYFSELTKKYALILIETNEFSEPMSKPEYRKALTSLIKSA
jgi:hypothetical protein